MQKCKRVLALGLMLFMLFGFIPFASIKPAYAAAPDSLSHSLRSGVVLSGETKALRNRFNGRQGLTIASINNHRLGSYEAFCLDPTLSAGNNYGNTGNASNSSASYWSNFGAADRRYIAALLQYYADHPYASTVNDSLGHSAATIAKCGTQLAVFQYVLSDGTRGYISEKLDDGSWYDLKGYCADAEAWARSQANSSTPSVSITLPSFNGQRIKLDYNDATNMYEATLTDTNGALSLEGYDFNQTVNGVQVSQSGNTVTLAVSAADAVAAGLNDPNNSWQVSSQVTKTVNDPVNMAAVKIYTSTYYANGEQPMAIFDSSVQPAQISKSETATLQIYVELIGYAAVTKSSADTTITNGNSCYSLEGAQYGFFGTEAEAVNGSNPVATVTTDASGASSTATLAVGNYFAKELVAPPGYALDTQVYPITIRKDETTTLTVSDTPTTDPVYILLRKVDAAIMEAGKTSGNMSLSGAEYTVEYYPAHYDTAEAAQASGNPLRSWVFRTNNNGVARLDADHLVSGDEFYYVDGQIVIPIGTVVIYETSAPTGYKLNSTKYLVRITEDGTDASFVNTYNEPTTPETAIMGGIAVVKQDAELGAGEYQGGASLAGGEFTIYNANDKSVTVNGTEVAPDGAVLVITTNDAGRAASADRVLPYGSYVIKETKAPTGYQLNSDWSYSFTVSEDGVLLSAGTCEDSIIRGGISVHKTDAGLGTETPYGDASFEGFVFEITNSSAQSVIVNGTTYAPGEAVMRITTNASGLASTGSSVLPYGSYTIKEVSVPTGSGYALNSDYSATVEVTSNGVVTVADNCPNTGNIFGGLSVQKVDADSNTAAAQGDASLAGAEFEVVNNSNYAVIVNGTTYAVGEVVVTITTDENGLASTGNILPMGTYAVKETVPSTGYLLNSTWQGEAVIRENNQLCVIENSGSCPETAIKGGVSVQKLDLDTGTNTGIGGILLNNAEITIINRSYSAIIFNGQTIEPYQGEFDRANRNAPGIVTRIYTNDEGLASTGDHDLPYGTYELFETKAPSGYLIGILGQSDSEKWHKTIEIREDGTVIALDGDDSVVDELARLDIRFNKEGIRGNNQVFLPNVAFRITKLDTGESHILVTDPNGSFDSANQAHSYHTNGNDAAVNEAGEVDDSLLNYEYGVWFGGGTPVDTLPDGSRIGAFIVGRYKIEELPCAANEGYVLCEPFEVELYKRENPESYFIGTITNNAPTMGTTLLGKDTRSHQAPAAPNCTLVDTISYSGLKVGKQYEVRGILMDKTTGEPVEINGSQVKVTKTFKPQDTTGTVTVEFKLDASELGGTSVVAFEYIYLNNNLVSIHDNLDDEDQTVTFPLIHTSAAGDNGGSEVYLCDEMTITDTVYYENLEPGFTYTVVGTLMDADTGEELKDAAGNSITKTKTFSFEDTWSGSVEVVFTFDGSNLGGKTGVVFEKLYIFGNLLLATHEELDDADQTVTFPVPTISTTLVDANGQHVSMPGGETVLTDHVAYENLVAGKEYKLEAKLVYPDGSEVKDAAGTPITQSHTFTPDEASGTEDVTFTINSSALEGKTVVAYEKLLIKSIVVAEHENPEDEAQSVHFPKLRTTATDKEGNKISEFDENGEVTIVDTISYENLIPGENYKVSGTLHDKATGGVIKSAETGEPYLVELEFPADEANGTKEVTFTVKIKDVQGLNIVVFENLMFDGKLVGQHADIEDEEQTVFVPYKSELFKYDASTAEGLAGAVFEIRDITNGAAPDPWTVTSDDEGYFFFNGLPGHEYSIKEIEAPEEYYLSAVEYFVTVGENGELTGDTRIPNVHGGTVVITKVDIITGDPLEGCEISVYDAENNQVFKQVTDASGKIYFYTTKAGTYTYKETQTCDGYYLNEDVYSFTIEADLTVKGTVRFGNVPFGTAVIKKVDKAGNPLPGAQIAVFSEDGDKFLGQGISAENGRVYFVSPGPGRYYFMEVKAPEGYERDQNKYHFTIADDYTITGTLTLVNVRNSSSSSTGDTTNLNLWVGMAAICLVGTAVGVYILLRKKKEEEN